VDADDASVAIEIFPIPFEHRGDERQFISFLTVDESKRKLSEVHIRLHCESGNRVVAFHRLGSQIDGQIMGLAVGEERLSISRFAVSSAEVS